MFFLASRSCEVAQCIPRSRISLFSLICSLRNVWSLRSNTPTLSSTMLPATNSNMMINVFKYQLSTINYQLSSVAKPSMGSLTIFPTR